MPTVREAASTDASWPQVKVTSLGGADELTTTAAMEPAAYPLAE